ncbi:MAG: iron-sulfur cluster co-chaperone HscB C-terminal domain-containing protein [Planctomycetota bacterium]
MSEGGPGDPWALLGLEPSFEIEKSELRAAHLRAVSSAHPDTAVDDAERARRTAAINRARDILADDERRAVALLALRGGPGSSEDKSLPDGFLMEMMELREQIEAELGSGDDEARARWESWADGRRAGHIERVREFFASGGEGALAGVRAELNAWRYIERLIEQLDPAYRHGSELDRARRRAGEDGDRG